MNKKRLLEIACFNIESAMIAESAGADRIEFCKNYKAGGLSPDIDQIKEIRERVRLPVHVMIRPRAGNFVYTDLEFEAMRKSILFCKTQKINGVVFGLLTANNLVNVTQCAELIQLAGPMRTCFHRAIDETVDMDETMKKLVELGFSHVLTSGGQKNALGGIRQIEKLEAQFGNKITLIAAGGIRSDQVKKIKKSNCREFHSSAITGPGETVDANEVKKIKTALEE